jgi:hypothetical protein
MATKNDLLQAQFKQDKLDGTTLCTKFKEWLGEQTEERIAELTVHAVEETAVMDKAIAQAKAVHDKPISKKSIANKIFEEELAKGLVRKNVLARFMDEANLTINGANTYYNNIREEHGLVQHRS